MGRIHGDVVVAVVGDRNLNRRKWCWTGKERCRRWGECVSKR